MGVPRATTDTSLRVIAAIRSSAPLLPAVVSEGLVGLGHAMRVLTLAHGGATVFRGVEQFVGEAMRHRFLGAIARGFNHPAHCQCLAAAGAHLDRDLVGRTADAA